MYNDTKKKQSEVDEALEELRNNREAIDNLILGKEDLDITKAGDILHGVSIALGGVDVEGVTMGVIYATFMTNESDIDERNVQGFILGHSQGIQGLTYFGKIDTLLGIEACNNELSTFDAFEDDKISIFKQLFAKAKTNKSKIDLLDFNGIRKVVERADKAANMMSEATGLGVVIRLVHKCSGINALSILISEMSSQDNIKSIINILDKAYTDHPVSMIKHYYKIVDTPALNLIKIVTKGTDNIQSQFTGDCTGIAIEAVVVYRDSIGSAYNTKLIKRYIHLGFRRMGCISDGNYIAYYSGGTGQKQGAYSLIDTTICNEDASLADKLYCMQAEDEFGTKLIRLLLPHGINLSESFKAKYVG